MKKKKITQTLFIVSREIFFETSISLSMLHFVLLIAKQKHIRVNIQNIQYQQHQHFSRAISTKENYFTERALSYSSSSSSKYSSSDSGEGSRWVASLSHQISLSTCSSSSSSSSSSSYSRPSQPPAGSDTIAGMDTLSAVNLAARSPPMTASSSGSIVEEESEPETKMKTRKRKRKRKRKVVAQSHMVLDEARVSRSARSESGQFWHSKCFWMGLRLINKLFNSWVIFLKDWYQIGHLRNRN